MSNNDEDTTTNNNVLIGNDDDLPQLLDSRGGSHVSNVPPFDEEDFNGWKNEFLIYLEGLEPFLLEILNDGPYVPMAATSTVENPLRKPVKQWSSNDRKLANQDKRLKSIIISSLPKNIKKSVIKCDTAKKMWTDLVLSFDGPEETRDTKITDLRLKFNNFRSIEGEKISQTYTRLKTLLNDLENLEVSIPQHEINATFVNSLPKKWLSMSQAQRANNSVKNDSLATLYGKYNYEETLIDSIYKSETDRFALPSSSSKALISNTVFQESDSDVEEDTRSSEEFMSDLNQEFQDRALLANQKRFYKRSGRVGGVRKPMDKSKMTCFACGRTGHIQKECPSNTTSSPSFPSKSKPFSDAFHQKAEPEHKDYKMKYKALKAELILLNEKVEALSKKKPEKKERGFIAETYDWNDEPLSSDDEQQTTVRAYMALAEDEPAVGKSDARSGQWVDITMKKVHRLLSMEDNDDRKHVLDYTGVDLHYVEDQRRNLVTKFDSMKKELVTCKADLNNLKYVVAQNATLQSEISRLTLENESLKDNVKDLQSVIDKWTCGRITLDELLQEQVPANITRALGVKGKKSDTISSKEIVFTSGESSVPEMSDGSDVSGSDTPCLTSPPPNLHGAEPILPITKAPENITPKTFVVPSSSVKKQKQKNLMYKVVSGNTDIPEASGNSVTSDISDTSSGISAPTAAKTDSTEKLLLTLMNEVKSLKEQIKPSADSASSSSPASRLGKPGKPYCTRCKNTGHLTKDHDEHLVKKARDRSTSNLGNLPRPYPKCKYCGFYDHSSDVCEFYPGCDICGSIAHEPNLCPARINRNPRVVRQQPRGPPERRGPPRN